MTIKQKNYIILYVIKKIIEKIKSTYLKKRKKNGINKGRVLIKKRMGQLRFGF